MRPNIPAKRVIDRFVEYHKRPFTLKDVANDTGLHAKTVRNLLPQLVREGRIRVMLREPSGIIYGKNSIYQSTGIQYDWRPDMDKLKMLYDNVKGFDNAKQLARVLGWSHETTARYLKILIVEGCVAKSPETSTYRQNQFDPTIRWFS